MQNKNKFFFKIFEIFINNLKFSKKKFIIYNIFILNKILK